MKNKSTKLPQQIYRHTKLQCVEVTKGHMKILEVAFQVFLVIEKNRRILISFDKCLIQFFVNMCNSRNSRDMLDINIILQLPDWAVTDFFVEPLWISSRNWHTSQKIQLTLLIQMKSSNVWHRAYCKVSKPLTNVFLRSRNQELTPSSFSVSSCYNLGTCHKTFIKGKSE